MSPAGGQARPGTFRINRRSVTQGPTRLEQSSWRPSLPAGRAPAARIVRSEGGPGRGNRPTT
jgi:hypothetical protein